ncbi:MAG: cupin domain-containing protein [Bryobacteraceae bacterium]|nr:cupin domain-containing protein [Bryobacteraceae bacterium]
MPILLRVLSIALPALIAAALLSAAERRVDPTFLRRSVPELKERKLESISTPTCHYRPIFGEGDEETRIVRSLARFAEITVDPGGNCLEVTHARQEEVYVILEGEGTLLYGDGQHAVRKHDFMYLPPTVRHRIANSSAAPLRLLVYGYRIPQEMEITVPDGLMKASIDEVPLQVVGGHPPSAKFRLLMGTTESKRDKIAAAHVLTSLFVMEFEPGGTNFPHHHETEEEVYYLWTGTGDMVAGGGMDGIEGKHPAQPGDAYFVRLNCTVGFYASSAPGSEKARIIAARSLFPFRRR